MTATAAFTPTKWDEKPYEQLPAPMQLTKASIEMAYTGQMEGQGIVEWLMFYSSYDKQDPHRSTATYLGLTRFRGKLGGRSGSFVMEDRGVFESGQAKSELTILAGSGTEGLKGITGQGSFVSTQKGSTIELNYDLG